MNSRQSQGNRVMEPIDLDALEKAALAVENSRNSDSPLSPTHLAVFRARTSPQAVIELVRMVRELGEALNLIVAHGDASNWFCNRGDDEVREQAVNAYKSAGLS